MTNFELQIAMDKICEDLHTTRNLPPHKILSMMNKAVKVSVSELADELEATNDQQT
jgi:hypothetical protein